jgi:hypothetical protein
MNGTAARKTTKVDPRITAALINTKLSERYYDQPAAYSTDDARKLLEAGVESRGGWCGIFAASAISLLAIAAVVVGVL